MKSVLLINDVIKLHVSHSPGRAMTIVVLDTHVQRVDVFLHFSVHLQMIVLSLVPNVSAVNASHLEDVKMIANVV